MTVRDGGARLAGHAARAAGALVATVAVLLATAAEAVAQSVTPTQNVSGTSNPVGGYVFLGVSAVIIGTALILYLRHRTPKAQRNAGGTGTASGSAEPSGR